MIIGLKMWLGFVVIVTSLYALRHFFFAFTRLYRLQRHSYQDIAGTYLPSVCVMIPMYNEEVVAHAAVAALKNIDYPLGLFSVIIIDDHSEDNTPQILDELCRTCPQITVLHRSKQEGIENRGKPVALNDALKLTYAEVIVTFDADYWPSRDSVMRLVAPLMDPGVALTMGRVVPRNPDKNSLTRMLDLERAGGYQVNQQARHTLGLLPQYGGTVGAIRRSFLISVGGWNPAYLAEDTYLTVQAFIRGLRVTYVNLEETTEEVPDTWKVRQKQLRRWVIGHNQVACRIGPQILFSPFLSTWQRLDAIFLLLTYFSTMLLATGYVAAILLLLLGEGLLASVTFALLILTTYSTLGNSAAFIEIATAAVLDGRPRAVWVIPGMIPHFFGSLYVVIISTIEWVLSEIRGKTHLEWQKTARTGGT